MFLNTNLGALEGIQALQANSLQQNQTLQEIATGDRITSAASDPSGLAISELMQSQASGLGQASSNAQNGMSLLQTADGSMSSIDTILQSMRSLASEAATGTNNANDLTDLQAEMNQYAQEITNITNTTQFNDINLLAGGFQNQTVQIGANQGQAINLNLGALDAVSLGVSGYQATGENDGIGTTGLQLGSGLAANSSYTVKGWGTGASVSTIGGNLGGSSYAAASVTGTFTGTANVTYTVSVTSVSASTIYYAVAGTDGFTYNTTAAVASPLASIGISDGSSALAVALGTTGVAAGQTVTFGMAPAQASFELDGSSGQVTGGTVATALVFANGTITIGNSSSGSNSNGQVVSLSLSTTGVLGAALTTVGASVASASAKTLTFTASYDGTVASPPPGGNLPTSDYATVTHGINISSQASAEAAITQLDGAIQTVDNQRANVGAWMNRLQFASQNANTEATNLQQANAGYVDANMAQVTSQFVQQNVLVQADVGVLAQADQLPAALLKLIP